jgi:hypothetical protein
MRRMVLPAHHEMNPRPYHLITEGALDAGANELYLFIVQSNSSGSCI